MYGSLTLHQGAVTGVHLPLSLNLSASAATVANGSKSCAPREMESQHAVLHRLEQSSSVKRGMEINLLSLGDVFG